jgi:aspartyl-tRNA(Asn)/glutamyl-tRNA(Gln) amidotransferase subunit A
MMNNLDKLTIVEAAKLLRSGDLKASDLTDYYLKNIEKQNKDINAYLEVFDDCLDQAKEADKKIASKKDLSLMTGIPIAVKDNILIKGRRAGAASKILDNYFATYDSTVIRKLKEAGSIFLGRTNMDEFAMGSSTENSAYGSTKNPHDLKRVPGGSSGGSAAAVAMDGALASLGSDTGGSIRQPASLCGLVGLKPTYGSVSRHGLMAMGSSLDQIGPMTKTVDDCKIIFDTIRGKDRYDATSIDANFYSTESVPKKFVAGIPKKFTDARGVSVETKENFEKSVKLLEKAGVEVREIDMPNIHFSLPTYYIIMPAEVSSNMARYDGMKFGSVSEGNNLLDEYMKTRGELLGKEVRRRIILGTYVLSAGYYDAYYGQAIRARDIIRNDFAKVFASGVHFVVTPTTPTTAFKIGEKSSDPLQMYLADIFTVTANVAGVPAISIPSGISDEKLPFGIQFTADFGREDILFSVGSLFEKAII